MDVIRNAAPPARLGKQGENMSTQRTSSPESLVLGPNALFSRRCVLRRGLVGVTGFWLGTHGRLSFNELKALTDATDGNLSTHSQKLEAAGYVRTSKGMLGRRTKTSYEITPVGRQALMSYLDALDGLMGEVRGK